ncbi:FMN-dependent NADH-azoreductase [Paraburkholderia gardini]|uniref:FMN dependent NADH:quinone oxidoreductase n=1 Tax=Paraburkholderia gardini TaxID=2823469 RepID=A0ABN7QMN8_9BURK|nr:NAD(P)H-dependent oxidoreductase [Paraburkholderia gardini]CAG4903052.1 FMN-dependent NADH-azoreductase [Paraburkholderia gardini]CAG4910083.1 FMN-dependent NADH-azoreductase [Paraburkholderia gardini]
MNDFLFLSASPNQRTSIAYRFADALLESFSKKHPAASVNRRDLAANPLPPLSAAYGAALTKHTPLDDPAFRQSEHLIAELERSSHLLIATPMHNFTLPATLKLWIDHVLRIGRSFSPGPDGKVGLLADRPTYIIVSSGGFHRGPQARQPDCLSDYLRLALRTIGISDCHFIYLQGLVGGEGAVAAAFASAHEQLSQTPLFAGIEPMSSALVSSV